MFRQAKHSPVRRVFKFLILLLLAGVISPFQMSAAPPAQDADVCALMPPGAASSSKIPTAASVPEFKGGCQATYRTGIFAGTNQAEVMLMVQLQIWSPSDIARQRVMQCSMVTPGIGTCTSSSVGEVGADFTDKPPSTYWWADSARGCFWFRTSSDYSADPAVIAQGRAIHKQIDDKLKTLPPCPGIPPPVPAQLNVGIGGNYDAANERVNVSATVDSPAGIGDDYYEWTLDGAPIQKGKELKSIEYDTTNLAEGEHEIVVKVTDIKRNVTGGATYKFTVKRNKGNPPPNPANAAQVQITTPSGTQTLTPGVKTPVTLQSGKAELKARCEAAVYGLLTYLTYKEGDDPDSQMFRGRALALAIMVQAYCDKLLAMRSFTLTDALARPRSLQAFSDAGAGIEIDVQEGAGQFEITNAKTAIRFLTANARADAFGKQSLIVGYDPATQTTLVRALNGTVNVTPANASRGGVTLYGGQQVHVTANGIGDVQQTQNAPKGSSVPGTTLSMPAFGSAEPYPSVPGRAIQFAQRRVPVGESVLIPVWLMNANDVANINAEVTFDANVARPEGDITKGYLLDNALFSANANESGIVRIGFAQATNIAIGTGTMAYIPFRAVGNPGDRTTLTASVTALNDQNGGALSMDRINGEIVILNKDGTLPGDDGTNSLPLGACSGKTQLSELDALCALEIAVQLRPAMQIMDVDGNGAIDSRDAVLILTRVMGGQ